MGRPRKVAEASVLAAILTATGRLGAPPTIEELRREIGVGSTRTVLRYLRWLEEGGRIERRPGSRGIRLIPRKASADQESAILQELEELLIRHRAWIFLDCRGAVLWIGGAPAGRISAAAADGFRLELDREHVYGCDDDAPEPTC